MKQSDKLALAGVTLFLVWAFGATPEHKPTSPPPPHLAPSVAAVPTGDGEAAAAMVRSLRRMMRNPDSFQLIRSRGNADASVLCVAYRAQNGFGGMNVEVAALDKNVWHVAAGRARKICRQRLDFDYTRFGLSGVGF